MHVEEGVKEAEQETVTPLVCAQNTRKIKTKTQQNSSDEQTTYNTIILLRLG